MRGGGAGSGDGAEGRKEGRRDGLFLTAWRGVAWRGWREREKEKTDGRGGGRCWKGRDGVLSALSAGRAGEGKQTAMSWVGRCYLRVVGLEEGRSGRGEMDRLIYLRDGEEEVKNRVGA